MSGTTGGPPLNASGSDPGFTPPNPPPADASNDPADRARGVAGEASADDLAAIERARRPAPPTAEAVVDPRATPEPAEPKPANESEPQALDADGKPIPKPDNTPPWMKAEITKERNRAREATEQAKAAQDAAAAAQKRLDEALDALKALTPKPAPEPIAEPRPSRELFASPEAYDTAIEQWATRNAEIAANKARAEAETAAKTATETAQREAAEKAQADYVAKTEANWKERRDKAAAEIPDFAEFAESDKVTISEPMGFAIKTADNGPQIAYHLGKNPTEAARIAALPLGMQIFEMGKLAATLAIPARPAVSRAPAPIAPLNGTTESPTDREESMAEVAARVSKREAAGRHPIVGSARPH